MGELGERRLGTTEAVAESMAIGPVVSVGFVGYLVAAHAGGATPLAIALAFAGALALGRVLAHYGRRYAGAGTVYEYLATGGRLLAVIAGGAYFFVAMITAAGGLLTGLLLQQFCVAHLGFDPGWWPGGLLTIALVATLVHLGVRLSARWLLALTALSTLPLLLLAGAIMLDGGHTLRVFDPGQGDVPEALLYAVTMFLGFEAAACLGEESGRPHRTIPRGMLLAIALCGVFYVVTIYALTIGFGADAAAERWGQDPFAVIALGDERVGRPLSALIFLGVIVDLVAFLIAISNAIARGYFTLARDGLLPSPLAAVSQRGTPAGGITVVATANLAALAVAAFADDRLEVFEAMFAASPLISLTIYLLLCALAVRLLRAARRPPWEYALLALGAAVPALGLYGSFVPFPSGPRLVGLFLAAAAVAAAAVWALWLHRVRPAAFASAAGQVRVAEAPGQLVAG